MALLNQPEQLSKFQMFRQDNKSIRDLLVCTHGNHDVSCGRFGYPLYRTLKQDYADTKISVWQCSHFGGHQFAPTLLDMPEGRYWGHLEPEILDLLIYRQGSVADLRSFYRGWGGLHGPNKSSSERFGFKKVGTG